MSIPSESGAEVPLRPTLLRALGPWMGIAIVVGTVIGSGVFVKPRMIAHNVPDFAHVSLVWVLGGILTLFGALAIAEVAVLFPVAGGNYIYLRDGYGNLAGFLWGWVEFGVIRAASIAALSTAFVDGLHRVVQNVAGMSAPWLSPTMRVGLTVSVIALLAAVNCRGVRWGGGLQLIVTVAKVGSLLFLMVLPYAVVGFRDPEGIRASLLNQPDSATFSWTGLGAAFLGVVWAYHGWMSLAPVAGEVKEPQRNLPIALGGGMVLVMFLYLGENLAYCLAMSLKEMADLPEGSIVAAEVGGRLLGPMGEVFTLAAVMTSMFGAANGNLLAGARVAFAMGDDGLAPRWLSEVHPRFRTPNASILALAGFSMLLVVGGAWARSQLEMKRPLFDMLTDFAMFGAVIFETLAVTTIFVFRRRLPDVPRAYRCPGYPWVPLLSLTLPIFVLGMMFVNQPSEALFGVAFIGVGTAVYAVQTRTRST
jgi:APA family basic amino acid/polyamine antiporter